MTNFARSYNRVAVQPQTYPLETGTITASGQSVSVNTDLSGNIVAHVVASPSFSNHNVTFEASIDSNDGTDGNWFGINAVRTNANTIELVTGAMSATPAYGWEISTNGFKFIRVRATAHTSGTAVWKFQGSPFASETAPAVASHPVTMISTTISSMSPTIFADTVTPLTASATFTGTARDGAATAVMRRFAATAVASHAGTFYIELSTNSTNWYKATAATAVTADTPVNLMVEAVARYYRVVFVNGGTGQTSLSINSGYFRV